jgi:hypothetical protein
MRSIILSLRRIEGTQTARLDRLAQYRILHTLEHSLTADSVRQNIEPPRFIGAIGWGSVDRSSVR